MSFKLEGKLSTKKLIIIVLSIITLIGIIFYSTKLFVFSFDKKNLVVADAKIKDFNINGNYIISTSDDSQLDFTEYNAYVANIKINFSEPIEKDSIITVYYNLGNGYLENQKLDLKLKKGDSSSAEVPLNAYIRGIRIDFVDKAGQRYSVNNIEINSNGVPFITILKYYIKALMKLSLILFLYIAIVILIKKINFSYIFKAFKKFITYLTAHFTKKFFTRVTCGLLVISVGLLFEFIIGYTSFKQNNDGIDMKLNNSTVVSKDISILDGKIVTKNDNSSLVYNLDNKYIKDLAITIESSRDTKFKIRINGETEKNIDRDYYVNCLNLTEIPVVCSIESKVNTLEIITSKNIVISRIEIINHYNYNFPRGLFYSSILFICYCTFLMIKSKKVTCELIFLTVSLTVGTLYAIALPLSTGLSWDDQIHYKNAVSLLSNNEYLSANEYNFSIIKIPPIYSLNERQQLDQYIQNNNTISAEKQTDVSVVNAYNMIGYLPSAIVISLGNILHIPYYLIFIFGRFANVFVYSLVVYFAIKKLVSGKMIMAMIALFPTAMFLATSYTYDYWVTCFLMLGFAYLFSELQQPDKKITTKECVIMLSAFVLGLGPKAIYFPIMLLMLLIKPNKFESKKQCKYFRISIIIMTAFVISSFILPFFIAGSGGNDPRGGSGVNSIEQVKYILSSPINYFWITVNFLKGYLSLEEMNTYTTQLAYLQYGPNFLLLLCTYVAAIFTDKNNHDRYTSTKTVRASIGAVFIVTVVLITTALYVAFNPVASTIIAGVQGRYLIPILFPVALVIGSCKIKNNIKKEIYTLAMVSIPTFVLLQTIWELCIKLYY